MRATSRDGRPAWADLRSADGLFVCDERQRLVAWSASAEALLGHRAEEVLGSPCYEVVAGREPNGHPVCARPCRVVLDARRGRVTAPYHVVAQTRSGEPRVVEIEPVVRTLPGRRFEVLHLLRPIDRAATDRSSPVSDASGAGARSTQGPVGSLPARGRLPVPDEAAPVGQPLSRRELEVLRLVAMGRTTDEIAVDLRIARLTARNHINNLERKLGARSRVEAVVLGAHHGLI